MKILILISEGLITTASTFADEKSESVQFAPFQQVEAVILDFQQVDITGKGFIVKVKTFRRYVKGNQK